MKVTAKWEVTMVINRELKKKKRKIDRQLYLRMLRETQKYTLLQRVTSELYRAGVSPQRFLRELHKDDWSMSTRVMEELERIDKGRNGYDPDRVPPVLPVYLKPVSVEHAVTFKGRPTRQAAMREALAWAKLLIARGWTEGDIKRAIDDILEDEDSSKVVIVKADDDLEEKQPKKAATKLRYYVHDGMDWQIFASATKAKEALAALKSKVMDNIRRAEPMQDITSRICNECKQPLNGHVLTLRGPKVGKKRPVIEHLHENCFWLKRAEPCRIPVGMTLICPADGKPYTWMTAEKGGWQLKKNEPEITLQKDAGHELANSSPVGVPGANNPNAPTALPVAKAT